MLSSILTHQLADQAAAARQHSTARQQPTLYKHPRLRCRAADRPGEHDAAKGIGSRRGSLDEQATAAAAAAAAPAGQAPSDDSSKPEAARVSEDTIEINCEAAVQQQQTAGTAAAADDSDDEEDEGPANLDELVASLERKLAMGDDSTTDLLKRLKREPVLGSLDLQGVAQLIQSGKAQRIIVMTGAGVSVSAGIPDFRTPGTGLYSQLERFGLPEPEAVFSIGFFKKKPKPFHLLAKELFPGNYQPTPTHHFIKLLHDKGLLLRCFTQNIDSLEHQAGLPQQAVVAAHGNFDSAHCIKCGKEHSLEYVKQAVFSDSICLCNKCGAYVKPDIVFFGEQLPDRFYERMEYDFPTCDLLLVMGTSLVVHPFASLVDAVPDHCPRVLINRERVGEGMGGGLMASLLGFGGGGGFMFEGSEGAYRDVLYLGDTDDGVKELAGLLGWEQELETLIAAGGIGGGAQAAASSIGSSSSSSAQRPSATAGSNSQQDSSNAAEGPDKGVEAASGAAAAAASKPGNSMPDSSTQADAPAADPSGSAAAASKSSEELPDVAQQSKV